MTRLLTTLTFAAITLASAAATAGSPTLQVAVEATFDEAGSASNALAKLGAKPGKVLVAERLPDGSYAVETSFVLEGNTGRLPLRLKKSEAGWEPVWQAEAAYGTALGNILKSGTLPASRSERAWTSIARMPSFPVVVTAKRVITPFGVLEKPEGADEQPTGGPRRGRPKATGPLPTSQELARHTERWIASMLADDPAPAGLDLIIDGSITWERFNAALFSIAGVGLYVGEIIAVGDKGWVTVPFAAPVSTATAGKPPELVLAYYPGEAYGFRIVKNRQVVATGEGCEEPMALCGPSANDFAAKLPTAVGAVDRAMFASGPNTVAADAISYLEAATGALGLVNHRMFVGYISL